MITRSKTSTKQMAANEELKKLFDDLKRELGGKIDKLSKQLEEKDSKIEELEKRYELLERRLDDSEQYSRMTCLRVNGTPYNGNETAEKSLELVKNKVAKLGVRIRSGPTELDRAHRVGFSKDKDGNPVSDRQMIVKFTTFRARTLIYRSRPKYGNRSNDKVRFYIDQTKRRFQLKKMAMDYVKAKLNVDFVFVDINSSLCIKLKNGEYRYFNSHEELVNLVG